MVSDFVPFIAPVAGVALTAICCAVGSWCTTRRALRQTEALHQRILVLEQAPAKVVIHGPPSPVYYQPPPVVPTVASPSATQPIPSASQPKPSAPPSYPSYYPPYSSAYQGQQYPVVR